MAATVSRQSPERWLLAVEAAVGVLVVAAIVGRSYGVFPTLTFLLCGAAVAYTGWVGSRMVASLRDPTLEVSGRLRDFERERLEGEKRLLLQGIKDLEIDRQTGKMDDAEYRRLRETAEARAITIIGALRASDEKYQTAAEALVTRRLGLGASPAEGLDVAPSAPPEAIGDVAMAPSRPKLQAEAVSSADATLFEDAPTPFRREGGRLVCGHCGHENDEDAKYCAGCGRPRAQEAA